MDVYSIVTEKILEKMEKGTIPWQKPWRDDGSLPTNLVSKKSYRGVNLFTLPNDYPTNFFVTFKQANALGGGVKAGEKGHLVVFWKFFRNGKQEETDSIDSDTMQKSTPMLRYYKVWNVAQCWGLDSKIPKLKQRSYIPSIETAEYVRLGYFDRPQTTHNESRAYYSPMEDRVNMPKKELFAKTEGYYSTLFHEFGHSTGHNKRINRTSLTAKANFGSKDYSKEELVAEMTAAYLCGFSGIENTIENSAAYIKGWVSVFRNDKRMVVYASAAAQKASDYILRGYFGPKYKMLPRP